MNKIEMLKKHDVCFDSTTFDYDEYNKHATLKQRDDIIVEATRVILNEQFDKITNIAISQLETDTENYGINTKPCKNYINWKNEEQWGEIPNPKNIISKSFCTNTKTNKKDYKTIPTTIKLLTIEDCQRSLKIETIGVAENDKKNHELIVKYFNCWKCFVKVKKDEREIENKKVESEGKINELVERLKVSKKIKTIEKIESTSKKTIDDDTSGNFKNRFKAQKQIIETQKAKLAEKDKIIEELKLGKIYEEITKSLENARVDIQEIFDQSSTKVKCKVLPKISENLDDSLKFIVNTSKAPKIMQKMEARAMQRAKNRQIILERKRIIDETKKRLIEEALERKRIQDEEEKHKSLEAIKERRRKELVAQKLRQANKQRYLENMKKAENFYKNKLLQLGFYAFTRTVEINEYKLIKSEVFYEKKIKIKIIQNWLQFIEDKYKLRNSLADNLYKKKLLKQIFCNWQQFWFETIQSQQVAEDLYEMRLQNKIFIHWHRYVCIKIVARHKMLKKAETHYNNRILFQYFYQWRSLSAVLLLEKAKEEKKLKWRKKVLEVIPDYKPPLDD